VIALNEKILLDELKYSISKLQPKDLIGSFTGDSMRLMRRLADEMTWELSTAVLAQKVLSDRQEFIITYPASWWQHLKRDHLPKGFTRRYPVRFRPARGYVDFTRYDAYPKADFPVCPPNTFGAPYMVERYSFSFRHSDEDRYDQCYPAPEGKPRFTFLTRKELAAALLDLSYARIRERAVNEKLDIDPRDLARILLDTLEHVGVNPDQLVTDIALHTARSREA
jgi:hypothetical protein